MGKPRKNQPPFLYFFYGFMHSLFYAIFRPWSCLDLWLLCIFLHTDLDRKSVVALRTHISESSLMERERALQAYHRNRILRTTGTDNHFADRISLGRELLLIFGHNIARA